MFLKSVVFWGPQLSSTANTNEHEHPCIFIPAIELIYWANTGDAQL